METRRAFIKKIFMTLGVLVFGPDAFAKKTTKITMKEDIKSTVYVVKVDRVIKLRGIILGRKREGLIM